LNYTRVRLFPGTDGFSKVRRISGFVGRIGEIEDGYLFD